MGSSHIFVELYFKDAKFIVNVELPDRVSTLFLGRGVGCRDNRCEGVVLQLKIIRRAIDDL